MASYGYAKVSTKGQNPDLQLKALAAAGCAEVFADRAASGTQARRPQLDALLAKVERGDENRGVEIGPTGTQHPEPAGAAR